MLTLSPNIELQYTEVGDDLSDRVRAAAADGFTSVEMWGTGDRDVPAIAAALRDSGVALTSVLTLPRTNFTTPGADLDAFYAGLQKTVADARVLGSPRVVVGAANGFTGMKRAPSHERVIEVLREAVRLTEGSGVDIVLEGINSRVDHPGAMLDRTEYVAEIVRAVGSPRLTVLLDLYHVAAQGDDIADALSLTNGILGYVQLADSPGRGEPGSGSVDWSAQLTALMAAGYSGPIGLEYFPTRPTGESLEVIKRIVAEL